MSLLHSPKSNVDDIPFFCVCSRLFHAKVEDRCQSQLLRRVLFMITLVSDFSVSFSLYMCFERPLHSCCATGMNIYFPMFAPVS